MPSPVPASWTLRAIGLHTPGALQCWLVHWFVALNRVCRLKEKEAMWGPRRLALDRKPTPGPPHPGTKWHRLGVMAGVCPFSSGLRPEVYKQHFNFTLFRLYIWSQQEGLFDTSSLVVARRRVFWF